ncbi:uncharacterized protein isoform X2 [Rhodnius prolixus]|uniref:uncharacterized protein isoform X2 n=1 Tax=Rhodnius prolixus TaxID=13249 RepID=UPI003D18CAA9
MDFLSTFRALKQTADELERERNEHTEFMKGYWNYAVNEVKSSKNFDIKCLDSPGTRKRKLAEEVAENGNQRQGATLRKGRSAAKRVLEVTENFNDLQAQVKQKRTTKGRNKKKNLNTEETLEHTSKTQEARTEVAENNVPDSKSANNTSEKRGEKFEGQRFEEQKNQTFAVEKKTVSPEFGKNEAVITPKYTEQLGNDSDIKDNVDNNKTVTSSSAVDIFDENDNSKTIVNDNSGDSDKEESNKLKMNAVVLLKRINLKTGMDEIQKSQPAGLTDGTANSEDLKQINEFNDLISNEKTIWVSNDQNRIPVSTEDILSGENETENVENEVAKTSDKITSKTSSERWVEELMTRNDNKENNVTPEVPCSEEKENLEEEGKEKEIIKKGKPNPQSEPSVPVRSRVKEMAQLWENEGNKCASLSKNRRLVKSKKLIHGSEDFKEAVKVVPLKATNKSSVVDEQKRREEEIRKRKQKEEEASKKKVELIKARTEELKRIREYKIQKVFATREAVEKEKLENLAKCEKEKEEKEKIMRAEIEKLKEEQLKKKKLINMQKAQEAEERRLREENARLARLREQEEEQKRQAEIKLKQQEEAEKLLQQRKHEEEMRAKEASKNRKPVVEKPVNAKNNQNEDSNSYEITPHKIEREPMPLKDEENYEIDDLRIEDSEDEENPRKVIPKWARKSERKHGLTVQNYVDRKLMSQYFVCPSRNPDLKVFFGKYTRYRVRTSSAVWRSPPGIV